VINKILGFQRSQEVPLTRRMAVSFVPALGGHDQKRSPSACCFAKSMISGLGSRKPNRHNVPVRGRVTKICVTPVRTTVGALRKNREKQRLGQHLRDIALRGGYDIIWRFSLRQMLVAKNCAEFQQGGTSRLAAAARSVPCHVKREWIGEVMTMKRCCSDGRFSLLGQNLTADPLLN
jgi:hypothetical protein